MMYNIVMLSYQCFIWRRGCHGVPPILYKTLLTMYILYFVHVNVFCRVTYIRKFCSQLQNIRLAAIVKCGYIEQYLDAVLKPIV